MNIAFEVFGGKSWTGGINYLVNLLSAIAELPGRPLKPVLFAAPDTPQDTLSRLAPFLSKPPVLSRYWMKGTIQNRARVIATLATGRDLFAAPYFRRAEIDLAFVHASWFGAKFPYPTLCWIGDFQHRAFPQMFSKMAYAKREYGFRLLTRYATMIMASSNAGCEECLSYFPETRGRLASVPFAVKVPASAHAITTADLISKYSLPEKFLYLPNQFWRHKNHERFFDAVIEARKSTHDLCVVCSGNPMDPRDAGYYPRLEQRIKDSGSDSYIRLLGMIPYDEIFALMRSSLAFVNPSLYEGWSTTVEEAKALGVPMILSNIAVHREQASSGAWFFNPADTADMASVIGRAWADLHSPSSPDRVRMQEKASLEYPKDRVKFAETFLQVAQQTLETWNRRAR